jgi:hypothetical protein
VLQEIVPFDVPRGWEKRTTIFMPDLNDRFVLLGESFNSEHGCTIERYFEIVTPCLVWTGWNNGKGHGKFSFKGRDHYTHRHSFELANNVTLETEDIVDHLCRNRPCWNPDHLEHVTMGVNTMRGLGVHSQFKPRSDYVNG